MIKLSYTDLLSRVKGLGLPLGRRVYGVPTGGIFASLLVVNSNQIVESPFEADFFLDDIIDSGKTRDNFVEKYGKPFYALVDKLNNDSSWRGEWISFPWERMLKVDGPKDNIIRILQYIGEDPNREGLKDTPERVIRSYEQLFSGYKQNPESVIKTFEDFVYDEMIILKDVEFYYNFENKLQQFFWIYNI